MLQTAVVSPSQLHAATIIFLHGLGDSGLGWQPVGQMLAAKFPSVKWIFPHAPQISVTLNNGMKMPAWYDIAELAGTARQDELGMMRSAALVSNIIKAEIDLGIPSHRIVVGGFSQGAAMALLVALTTHTKLAGVVALSGYLPLAERMPVLQTDANRETRFLQCHGTNDQVVPFAWGRASSVALASMVTNAEFREYQGLGHSTSAQEMHDMEAFLKTVL